MHFLPKLVRYERMNEALDLVEDSREGLAARGLIATSLNASCYTRR